MGQSLTEEAADWLRNWEHQEQQEVARVVLAAVDVVGVQWWEHEAETHWREPGEHHTTFQCYSFAVELFLPQPLQDDTRLERR